MITQAMWNKDSYLKQLPHFTQVKTSIQINVLNFVSFSCVSDIVLNMLDEHREAEVFDSV